ncbi:MAG: M13 family metallopeptidase [Candidatus Dormibacteraceae bacterium]
MESSAPVSGIDTQYMDNSVRPQDDFYKYVNGKWLSSTPIPSDKARFGAFDKLRDDTEQQLRGILDGLQKSRDKSDPNQQKIADLYASFNDETTLNQRGLKPLEAELSNVDALQDKKGIPVLMAQLQKIGVDAPFSMSVNSDDHEPLKNAVQFTQSGLGLPDRDYYLQNDDKIAQIRDKYVPHIAKMLTLAGQKTADQDAKDILALETQLAQEQWTNVQNRDPIKTYNKVQVDQLGPLIPGFDWNSYLATASVQGKVDYVIVQQPSYFTSLSGILDQTPLSTWKAYFRWKLLEAFAPYLSKDFVDENFAFSGTILKGVPQNTPRWRRGTQLVNSLIGEGMGKLYVDKYFPPASKSRIDQLVNNLINTYKADVNTLDWMSPQTKQKAQEKLDKLAVKIGYPAKWRDYSALTINKGDLAGNVMRGNTFEYNREINKLGKPVDRQEWNTTPQTVNAYYDPEKNDITFPAAILQPPFFNPKADDAVNYGAIGAVIGHETSHAFDDQGSQYDAYGKLLDPPGWFTQADHDKFKAKTSALVDQYSAQEVIPGYKVNGELTLGENIADNSGVSIAYKAYQRELNGKQAPEMDNFTGNQRFLIGFAQIWREKIRDNEAIRLLKSDPHSPSKIRGSQPMRNMSAFFATFNVKPSDKMFLPPDQRVTIW